MSKSFSFPNLIDSKSGGFKEITDKEAVKQNIRLLLYSSKTELLGDPYFGTNLKRLIFEPNDVIIRDLVIDEILTVIRTFVKEVTVTRDDIKITQTNKSTIEISIKMVYNKDGENDLLSIPLVSGEEI